MEIKIGSKTISSTGKEVYVIAEIGNNHNGSFERAIELIDKAKEAGADCAKFQLRNLKSLYRESSLQRKGDDLSTEYTLDLLERFELPFEDHHKLAAHCKKVGIDYMCTPWDRPSVDALMEIGVPGFKVASADLTNLDLIAKIAEQGLPMILSTGMSREDEIQTTVDFLNEKKAQFAILHCNSTYPAPLGNINLGYLSRLNEIHPLIGYSGHERGIAVTLGAVALGAKIVERHFTLDRLMEGPDHCASLEFSDFQTLVKGIRELELAIGEKGKKVLSQGELINRENLGKSIIAARAIKAGETLKKEDLAIKSPGQGLSPQKLEQLIGQTAKRDLNKEDYFFLSDLDGESAEPRDYDFKRPWGVPVRYHDFKEYNDRIHPDIFEFHFSYQDMELDPADFLEGTYECGFVVHAPELFTGSMLMDMATEDQEILEKSILETQRVIDITRSLKKFFPKTERPMIVANIGGFSMDDNISEEEKKKRYDIFEESLKKLDMEGVELIPQTMAPFPWHFGGQRYQNLYVLPDEIVAMCKRLNHRMCLDVSHSKLTCNHFNIDFNEFLEKVGPYVGHLHLGDAYGVDGEGLQVGEGHIDFVKMGEILHRTCPDAPFIPEIWQGHKNGGQGFWIALDRLEKDF